MSDYANCPDISVFGQNRSNLDLVEHQVTKNKQKYNKVNCMLSIQCVKKLGALHCRAPSGPGGDGG